MYLEQVKFRAFSVRSFCKRFDAEAIAFNAQMTERGRAMGPWRRSFNVATGDAIAGFRPHERSFVIIVNSQGKVRELTANQYDAGRAQYHTDIEDRDASGVWG